MVEEILMLTAFCSRKLPEEMNAFLCSKMKEVKLFSSTSWIVLAWLHHSLLSLSLSLSALPSPSHASLHTMLF